MLWIAARGGDSVRTGDEIGVWVVRKALGSGGSASVYCCSNQLSPRIFAAIKVLDDRSVGGEPFLIDGLLRAVAAGGENRGAGSGSTSDSRAWVASARRAGTSSNHRY